MNALYISSVLQLVISILLVLLVLVQSKGGGLSSTFGGSITMYRSKRGVEKTIFTSTIVLGIALVVNSIVIVYLS